MGNKCGPTPAQQVTTTENPLQQQLVQQFSQFMGLDHPANINNKYKHIQKVASNQFIGIGINKTNAYKCLISPEELIKKRKEFWETRFGESPSCWSVLKSCCFNTDENNAFCMLAASGMKLVNKSIQMAFDEQGNMYEVPIFCVNEPTIFESTKIVNVNFIQQQLKVVIRSSITTKDEILAVSNTMLVSELKKVYISQLNLDLFKVRLMLKGKEMLDTQSLGNYEIQNQEILQAFIVKKQ